MLPLNERAEWPAKTPVTAIIQSIVADQQLRCMSLLWFQRNPQPTYWVAQREMVTGFDA